MIKAAEPTCEIELVDEMRSPHVAEMKLLISAGHVPSDPLSNPNIESHPDDRTSL